MAGDKKRDHARMDALLRALAADEPTRPDPPRLFSSLLDPWWNESEYSLAYDYKTATYSIGASVCDPDEGTKEHWVRLCEGLELFFLASAVVPDTFFEFAKRRYKYGDTLHVAGVKPRFDRLKLEIGDGRTRRLFPTWNTDALTTLLRPTEERSTDYTQTREWLLMQVQCPKKRRELDGTAVPVTVGLDWCSGCEPRAVAMLNLIVQLHTSRQSPSQGDQRPRSCFYVDSVKMSVDSMTFTKQFSRATELLVRTPGLELRSLYIRDARRNCQEGFQRWIRAVLGGESRENNTVQRNEPKRLMAGDLPDEGFEQLCASLARSRDVRSLLFQNLSRYHSWNPASRWAWLIYTIFHPDARHSVTSVDITDTDIQLSDILAIQATCDPWRNAAHSRQRQSTVGQMAGGYRVKTHRVTRLKLALKGNHCKDDSERGVKALLELIGWPLTHLSLCLGQPGLFDASYLNHVWQCCPKLIDLQIDGISLDSDSIYPILEAYALNKCSISSLNITRCMISDPSNVLPFVEALNDPEHAVAKKLQCLVLQLGDNNGDMSDEVLMAFLSVLQVNRLLRFVVLYVSKDQRFRFQTHFDKLNGPILRPLSLSSKYALLSVVKQMRSGARTEGESTYAMGQLDSLLLGKIFALAGNKEIRSVRLRCPK